MYLKAKELLARLTRAYPATTDVLMDFILLDRGVTILQIHRGLIHAFIHVFVDILNGVHVCEHLHVNMREVAPYKERRIRHNVTIIKFYTSFLYRATVLTLTIVGIGVLAYYGLVSELF